MTAIELASVYAELPEQEQIVFASLVAADQMRRQSDYLALLERRHRAMDEGRKWSHEAVVELQR
jgi:hypothetical protein